MFCSNCGKKLEEGTAFCPSCGNKVGSVQPKEVKIILDPTELVINEPKVMLDPKEVVDHKEEKDSSETFSGLGGSFGIILIMLGLVGDILSMMLIGSDLFTPVMIGSSVLFGIGFLIRMFGL